MVYVNTVLIGAMVVLLLHEIIQVGRRTSQLKENAGTIAGLVIWLLVVIAIGFQEIPWLRTMVEKSS